MTQISKLLEKDRRDECLLICGDSKNCPGYYVASVWYWKRTKEASLMSNKRFGLGKNFDAVKAKAESWVQKNLFGEYKEIFFRETET